MNGNWINTNFEFGVDRNTFQLEQQDPGQTLDGILCQKGNPKIYPGLLTDIKEYNHWSLLTLLGII